MISQQQTQKQQLKILPQQIQLLNLYFLNSIELEQRIKNELEENPFLETQTDDGPADESLSKTDVQDYQDYDEYKYDDAPDYKQEYQNYFSSDFTPNTALRNVEHFKDDAKQQLRLLELDERRSAMAEYLIDVLDNHGLLDKPMDEICDDYSFIIHSMVEVDEMKEALAVVQTLEPVGIGACSIQECLMLQLKQIDKTRPEIAQAYRLVKDHYNDLIHRQFEKIHHALNVDESELRNVLNFISTLKFYPVSDEATSIEPKNTIIPDFIITRYGENVQVHLTSSRSGSVFVNQSLYEQLSQQITTRNKSSNQYVKSKLQSAQWFVSAVKQREDTMMRIMQCIVDMQQDYFIEGDIRLLKPMVLRNVSEKSGLDISTISRITSNKYAETHFGIVYLKDLFSEGIADKKGEVISNKVIQSVIEEAVSGEDKRHPYTDQQLVNILSSKGYNIARRTVAKYREQLRIPIAQIRSVWA
ncbi:MAG: RNA polymerase sigma-54 factor [Sphingobacteriales bacterium]|nr:MAG: RNA polymerase sigma-54 factor [Sphingobacteriales bacterium]